MNKDLARGRAIRLINRAADDLGEALELIEQYDLQVTNYPNNWLDFNEHPSELRNLVVSDGE
jgi:hypothetical protein